VKILSDVSLDKEVNVKFWKSSGPGLEIQTLNSDQIIAFADVFTLRMLLFENSTYLTKLN